MSYQDLNYKIIKKMSDKEIIDKIGMAQMSKIIFWLEKKNKVKTQLIQINNDVMLRVNNLNVANMSYLPVYVHFITLEEKKLVIEGTAAIPASVNINEFYIRVNGVKQKIEFGNASLDLKIGEEVYEKRPVFRVEVRLLSPKNRIEFFQYVNNTECNYNRINFMRFSPLNDAIKGQYYSDAGWILRVEGRTILCEQNNGHNEQKAEWYFQKSLLDINSKESKKAIERRKKYFEERKIKNKKKPIWLIMDRADRAGDNGEIFFKYLKKYNTIDAFFIISEDCKDYERLKTLGNVVPMYSEKHLRLVLNAEYIISSQCNGYVENPYGNSAEYYRDIYHRPKLIFLQHGIIKDDMSSTLNRYETNFTGFITSTKAEYDSILEYPYYYEKDNIWLTGLPLFDVLEDNTRNIITIAPTWRKKIMHQEMREINKDAKWVPNIDISKSQYFKRYRRILTNKKLLKLCKKNGYKLVFKPHPLMEPFLGNITNGTEVEYWGSEVSYNEMLSKTKLLITDFSSLAMVYACLKKAIIYYQFDSNTFFKSHTYKKGYFSYKKNGYGRVCTTEKSLIRNINKMIYTNCKIDKKYKKRLNEIDIKYNNTCDNIYEKLQGRN